VNSLTYSGTEVTLESLNRLEKELRDNLSDPFSQFTSLTLVRKDGSTELVEVLDWLTEMKVKVREMKGKLREG
jgi:hypothetical protein